MGEVKTEASQETDPAPLLRLSALEVGYKKQALLPPVSLDVGAGALWAVLGPNGCGKTTLLRTVLGLLPKVSGQCVVSGSAPVGYVPQRTSQLSGVPQRVVDVVRGGVERGWSFANPIFRFGKSDAIKRALEATDTTTLARHQFDELSEGQKQRVLMARALVGDPRVLILDEPTSAMDVTAETRVFELLAEIASSRKIAVLLVSHHLSAVAAYATHMLFLDRERQVVMHGPIGQVARHPAWRERFGLVMEDALERRGCNGA